LLDVRIVLADLAVACRCATAQSGFKVYTVATYGRSLATPDIRAVTGRGAAVGRVLPVAASLSGLWQQFQQAAGISGSSRARTCRWQFSPVADF